MNVRTIGIRVAAAAILLAGCSSSSPADGGAGGAGAGGTSGATGGAAAAFVGTWTFGAGSSLQPMCGSAAISNLSLTGDVLTITEVDATHVHVSSTGGINCQDDFMLRSGSTTIFDAKANQTCMVTIGGATATVHITEWDLSLATGTISTTLNGTVSSPVSCTPMGIGTLTKS